MLTHLDTITELKSSHKKSSTAYFFILVFTFTEEVVDLDMEYIENWSFGLDIRIVVILVKLPLDKCHYISVIKVDQSHVAAKEMAQTKYRQYLFGCWMI